MPYRVLVSAPYIQPVIAQYRHIFADYQIDLVIPVVHERLEEDDLLSIIEDIDGVIAGDDRFTARVIDAAPRLKVLSKWGTGVDSFDHAACAAAGVRICNTPNAFSDPVADSVLGFMLAFARGIPQANTAIKAGQWVKRQGRALHECTLGIVGVGNVGKAVARRAAAFGMRILATDPITPPPDTIASYAIEMVSFEQLMQQSDFVSLNCDLNPTSYHLINSETLALMRADAVLINTARGPIVDEAALASALGAGSIGGAALDVFEDEPLPASSPLRSLSNVILSPHNTNSSPAAYERVHRNTIRNLLHELGLPPHPDLSE